MVQKDFYNLSIIRNRFDPCHIRAVSKYLKSDEPVMLPGEAASAIILLSACATQSDVREFGQLILNAETTNYSEPESLQEVLSYILSDPLDAACIERLTFSRRDGKVIIKLIDDSEIKIIDLPTVATPEWMQDAGVIWSREQLVYIASELQESDVKGEIISDEGLHELQREENREFEKLNHN